MFDFFKKKKITVEQQTSFEIELTAAVLAYEIARSDGEIRQRRVISFNGRNRINFRKSW